MSSKKLNFLQRVALEIVWSMSWLVAILPHWFRYRVLAKAIYLLVYRVFKYRIGVVRENLSNAFPNRSYAEREVIARDFYTFLSEGVVSTISLARRRPEKGTIISANGGKAYSDIGVFDTKGQNNIILTAHYGLWEYLSFAADIYGRYAAGVYHKLQNPIFDALFLRLRMDRGVILLPIAEASRFCVKHRDGVEGRPFSLGLIADQAPPRRTNAKWYTFLNQDTQFYDGGEKLALRLGMPVFFTYQKRLSAGRYQFFIEQIYDGVEPVVEGDITDVYVRKLESIIEQAPHLWLWSHRRWKRKKID
ncbi:MAG: lysophospholipid acyltransferase family protein [Rikenellaceae bacterium]